MSIARVLIGIPSFRRPDGLRRLLRSLSEQANVEELDVAVFVADNDAAAREAEAACREVGTTFRWPISCQVVSEPGISAARNAILDKARAVGVDYIAMIDDDEEAEPDWLHELLEMQRQTGADVVGGPVHYQLEQAAPKAIIESGLFQPRPWKPGPVPMIDATGNVLLSCAMLDRMSWPTFDSTFGTTGGEDKEFFTRLRSVTASFAWAPAAIVHEHVPVSRLNAQWLLRRTFRTGNSAMRIMMLHEGAGAILISSCKALAVLGTAPLAFPILLFPTRRLWVMTRWARAAGKLAALTGHRYHEYAPSAVEGGR